MPSPKKQDRIRLAMLGAQISVIMADRDIPAAAAARRAGLTIERAFAVVTGQPDVAVAELAALAGAVGARLEFSVHPLSVTAAPPLKVTNGSPMERGTAAVATL